MSEPEINPIGDSEGKKDNEGIEAHNLKVRKIGHDESNSLITSEVGKVV